MRGTTRRGVDVRGRRPRGRQRGTAHVDEGRGTASRVPGRRARPGPHAMPGRGPPTYGRAARVNRRRSASADVHAWCQRGTAADEAAGRRRAPRLWTRPKFAPARSATDEPARCRRGDAVADEAAASSTRRRLWRGLSRVRRAAVVLHWRHVQRAAVHDARPCQASRRHVLGTRPPLSRPRPVTKFHRRTPAGVPRRTDEGRGPGKAAPPEGARRRTSPPNEAARTAAGDVAEDEAARGRRREQGPAHLE